MVRKRTRRGGSDRGPSQRIERVGEILRGAMAEVLLHGLRQPLGMVSIMEVRVSPDLKNANVYVSFFGDEAERKNSLENLERAWGYVSRETAARVELRYMPKLHLKVDTTMEQADKIHRLIQQGLGSTAGTESADQTGDDDLHSLDEDNDPTNDLE